MSRTLLAALVVAATVHAAVPIAFSAGNPAKAEEMNRNFSALDTAIQKKAEASLVSVLQTAVAAKADQTKLDELAKVVAADTALLRQIRDTVHVVMGNLPVGSLLTRNNLAELKDSATKVRSNLGLGALATKNSLSAAEVGALDLSTADKRYLSQNGGILAGGTLNGSLLLRENSALRDSTGSWLFGGGSFGIGIGSAASKNGLPITLWNGTPDTAAIFAKDRIALRRTTFISGSLPLVLTGSGSGTYDMTTLYAFPEGATSVKGVYLEIPRLSNSHASKPSDFEINVRGGDLQIAKYDGTNDQFTLSRPTVVGNNLTVTGSLTANNKILASQIEATDLKIAGSITTRPTIPVADYVFEPGYQLTTLSEVESYTKEHKHLPEVPSASEIEKGGLDLAAMNLILLKKVEELTLHAIELEKRLKLVESIRNQ